MDPRFSAQDVLRCDLCETPVPPMYCDFCHVKLCKACVGEHLSDLSKDHKVVPYKQKGTTPKYPRCSTHVGKICDLHCEHCDVPVCSLCLSSNFHKRRNLLNLLEVKKSKENAIEKDVHELINSVYPKYEEILVEIGREKTKSEKHYEKLTTAVTKQGEDWHRKINIIVNKQKSEIDEMKTKHLALLNKQETEIKQITSDIKQCMNDFKNILGLNDVSLTFGYKSRNAEFRRLYPKVNVSLPSFSRHQINTEQIIQMFGSLSALSITTEEHDYPVKTPKPVSCSPVKPLLDEPELITTLDTGNNSLLYSVNCLSDEEIWTCGDDKFIRRYNHQGRLLKSIQTKSGNRPRDIAVTRSGDLVYTDPNTKTVNIVKNKQIQEVIRLQGWTPYNVCSTSSGDLLVTMGSDEEQTKVVCYSGSKEKQSIQFDSEGKPLYSSDYFKYISENRNLDICVADRKAGAVVVVNQAGKLRFRYTGDQPITTGSFVPRGITTDSQSQILTADSYNHCIHILDQHGQFLRYIDNCDLYFPWGLCADTRDNLFLFSPYTEFKVSLIFSMDQRISAQDVLRCDLCETPVPPMYCDFCHVKLCKACVGEHLSDLSKEHKVVPFKQKGTTPKYPRCPTHVGKLCELHCEECDLPVCSLCLSSNFHKGHNLLNLLEVNKSKKEAIEKDVEELLNSICPKYEEISAEIHEEKAGLDKPYEKLTTAVIKQGEDWHREINIIVNRQKSEIDEMKSKHVAALNKQEYEVKQITSDVKQSILDLKKILDSNDVSLTSSYKSRNAEFRNMPRKVIVALPTFYPHQINTDKLYKKFGSLSALSIATEEYGCTMNRGESVSRQIKPLLDKPELITAINTGSDGLKSVTCLSDEEIWTCGDDKIMKLYNLQSKLLRSIETNAGNIPRDIAMTRSGDLVYTDSDTRTVNIHVAKNKQIQVIIRLQGWIPQYVCSTSSGDLLVTMNSENETQSKVVRYSGSTEKQTIQFDSEVKPLYSSGFYSKYITENRNLNICVADYGAHAVVVVNQTGKLRFRYTGHNSSTKRSFRPRGITTDSQSQILIADSVNDCIHILDQDGKFLRFIDNCNLQQPCGLCVDTRDNLFAAECRCGNVKKIKYMKTSLKA
ncbi:uncharacterized protein LOC133186351 [Saccostrea echinata]|uniref:uncharacterized protein LOC133186351 n=1 Tax=Saccostrea echinata TaxID=191078 RepID=UPI002A81545A|nr:uncharacterized protein LOC133186351 [Saccostrea echinata]